MSFPRRILVVFLGFCGLLLSIGFRPVFAMVMVHVIKQQNQSRPEGFSNCLGNDSSCVLSLNWTVQSSLYFNTAYFVGGLFTQVPGGILATKFSAVRVCALSVLLSSIFMVVLPVCIQNSQYIVVMVIRTLQGLIEGPSVPAVNGVISAWAPKAEKSRMITVAYAGAYLSPAVAMVVSGALACHVCWNASLYLYGGLGILWSVLFMCVVYDCPAEHPSLSVKERALYDREKEAAHGSSTPTSRVIPWRHIFTSLPVYAVFVGSFCRNWIFSMLLTEIPQYMDDSFRLGIFEIGLYSSISEVCMTVVTVTGGVFIDKLIKSGWVSTTLGRKIAQCAGFGIEAVCILALGWITQLETAIVVMCVGVAVSGLAISGYQVNPLDLSPKYASVLTGLSRMGVLGAIISTSSTSLLRGRERTSHIETWHEVFWIAGGVHLAGVLFYGIFASGEKQLWADGPPGDTITERLINPSSDPVLAQIPDEEDRILTKSKNYSATLDKHDEKDTEDDTPDWFLQSMG